MDIEELIIQFVTKVLPYGGTGALVAYGIFRFFGRKWIENKFAERLEDHKHKLENEREELKFKINSLFNRVTKIHEKEFEVLPIAWEKLDNLLDSVRQFIRETHYIPELDEKTPSELEEFLSKKGLTEDAKKNILSSKNKKRQYFYEESKKVSSACLDFQDYITKNAIFLSSDLKSEFKKAEKTIRTAWATRDAWENSQDRNKGIAKACQITQEEIPQIMEEIEELVQNRLSFFEA